MHRQQLAEAEQSRQFFHRLHQDPDKTLSAWVQAYRGHCGQRDPLKDSILLHDLAIHTD